MDNRKKPCSLLWDFLRCDRGAVAIHALIATLLLTGAGAITIDYGRMVVVKNQLQNFADSAAAAGATFLDKTPKAIDNATEIIQNTIPKYSGIFIGKQNQQVAVESITFYSAMQPDRIVTTDPLEANFVGVSLAQHEVSFLVEPILDLITGNDTADSSQLTASAIASGTITACHVPPLMICDYRETLGEDYNVFLAANIGRQVKLIKESGTNTLAPGNFGVLDTPDGSQASQDISEAMASLEPPGCYGEDGTDTAPGVRAGPMADGINARFDLPSPPNNFGDPAPNVIHYPRDENMDSDVMGNGNWDYDGYWSAKHPGIAKPSALGSQPSRYQVYLYELGEGFAINGKQTLYPLPNPLPAGFTAIHATSSPGVPVAPCASEENEKKKKGQCDTLDPEIDGVAEQNPPVADPNRRVVEVVVLKCVQDNVKGNGGPYPNYGQFVEVFLTESVDSSHTIYGEILRRITPRNAEKLSNSIKYYE